MGGDPLPSEGTTPSSTPGMVAQEETLLKYSQELPGGGSSLPDCIGPEKSGNEFHGLTGLR